VWYHSRCKVKKGCADARLVEQGGCSIWYDEPQLLRDVKSYLGVVIGGVGPDLEVPVDEFDGKVTYGEKKNKDTEYKRHVDALAPAVADLARLEEAAQLCYWTLRHKKW
jgi:ATP-dependent RNA helicase DDX1